MSFAMTMMRLSESKENVFSFAEREHHRLASAKVRQLFYIANDLSKTLGLFNNKSCAIFFGGTLVCLSRMLGVAAIEIDGALNI